MPHTSDVKGIHDINTEENNEKKLETMRYITVNTDPDNHAMINPNAPINENMVPVVSIFSLNESK